MNDFFKKYLSLGMVTGIGLAVTFFIAFRTYHFAIENDRDDLRQQALEQTNILRESLKDSFGILDAIGAFYDSSDFVDRNEFRIFIEHFLSKYPYIQAVEWVPQVDHLGRSELESSAREDGLDFEITELDSQGHLNKAPEHNEYRPVHYVVPLKGNEAILGFDHNSDEVRRLTMKKAAETDQTLIIPEVNLQAAGEPNRLLVFKPIYKNGKNPNVVNQEIKGFASAVFEVDTLIKEALKNEQSHPLELSIFDVSEPSQEQFFYSTGADLNTRKPFLSSFYVSDELQIGGRKWEILVRAKEEFFKNVYGEVLLIMLIGLGLTYALVSYLFLRARGEERIKDEVKHRTAELLEVNERLRDSLAFRQKSEEQMKAALEMKAEFTSTVSHELRTPLASIKGSIDIVMQKLAGPLTLDQEKFLGKAKSNIDRLKRLIDDFLDLSKLESGRIDLDIQLKDMNLIIRDVLDIQRPVAEGKGLNLKAQLPVDLSKLPCDEDKINQVFVNLINNAIKFTEQGEVSVSARVDNGHMEFCVADTGEGIKQEDIPKLFEKFYQFGDPAKRKTGGTGLGLTICKEIIQQHGGKIWAESQMGQGSKFYFTLPLTERRAFNGNGTSNL